MKIFTFTADPGQDIPEPLRAVANIHLGGKDGFLPVVFRGATSDEARARAQAHWDEQLALAAKKVENRAAMSERRRKQPEAQTASDIEEAF